MEKLIILIIILVYSYNIYEKNYNFKEYNIDKNNELIEINEGI
jgi:hypothetical protein